MNMVLLEQCCDITMGQAPAGSSYNESGDGLALIAGAGDFGDLTPSPKKFTSAASKVSKPGDIILCIRATIGDTNWSDKEYCLGRGVAGLRAKTGVLDQNYLWYFIEANKEQLSLKGTGSTFKQVSRSHIAEWKIPLPTLEEQKRIAAILDKADALRRKRQQAIKLSEQFLKSVFLDMFGDPVTNPKRWEIARFGDVGQLDRGKSKHRPRNDPELLGGPYPLIQTGDVANSGGYIRKYKSTYSELGLKQSKIWPAGTLCITIAANIAKTGVLKLDACFPDSVVGFSPGEAVTVEYVRYWMGFLQKMLEANAPESAQKNINLEILRSLPIPLPPKNIQNNFCSIVAKMLESTERVDGSLVMVEKLFLALGQRAFSGYL